MHIAFALPNNNLVSELSTWDRIGRNDTMVQWILPKLNSKVDTDGVLGSQDRVSANYECNQVLEHDDASPTTKE